MKFNLALGALLHGLQALATKCDSCIEPSPSLDPMINNLTILTTGGEVRGFINESYPNVRQFIGVPYAEPPLGPLRFQPPVAKVNRGPIDATYYRPNCLQGPSDKGLAANLVPEVLQFGPDSEDCLYVNIYVPLHPVEEKLPVFIYTPGGGYIIGGANSLYRIPDYWVQDTQGHIVVSMK